MHHPYFNVCIEERRVKTFMFGEHWKRSEQRVMCLARQLSVGLILFDSLERHNLFDASHDKRSVCSTQ